MSNAPIKKHIGRHCQITTMLNEKKVVGKIVNVVENWIEVETKKNTEFVNAEFIASFKIIAD